MSLTDVAIQKLKPKKSLYFKNDRDGLSIAVSPKGKKTWYVRCQVNKKRGKIKLGCYPLLSLQDARTLAEDTKVAMKYGVSLLKKNELGENLNSLVTFKDYAARWKELKLKKLGLEQANRRQSTSIQIDRYLKKDMIPILGKLPLSRITKLDCLKVQRQIEARGSLSIAEKCRSWLNEIFTHAMAEGLIDSNPAADLKILALPQSRRFHNPYLNLTELPDFFKALENYQGNNQTILGVKLLFLTGVRTGELRQATPEQFHLDDGLWIIPADKVKQLKRVVKTASGEVPPYIVPLSTQAIAIIKQLLAMAFVKQPYLLAHRYYPEQMVSENTLNKVLHTIGYKNRLTGHGIRATISTALNEMEYPKDWIEAQLSHSDKDPIRASYNHAKYIEPRRKMMQEWADKLNALGMG